MTDRSFDRVAVITAYLSVPVAFASMVIGLAATQFDLAVIDDPALVLRVGAAAAPSAYWSMICDLFGYYLLLLPCAFALGRRLREGAPAWAQFATACGAGYVVIGASGAAVLAAVWPPLIRAYAAAPASDNEHIRLLFETLTAAVDRGLWNSLELTLAGAWWFVVGRLLPGRSVFKFVSLAVGLASWVDIAGTIGQVPAAASTGLSIYLILAPVWAGLCGKYLSDRRTGDRTG